jgi:hypothetical protein
MTREEIRQRRISRLLDELERTAVNSAEAEHVDGVDTGRHGVVSARLEKQRDRANANFYIALARVRAIVSAPAR